MNNGTHIKDGVIYSGGATSADQIAYDNTNSGLEATNTQEAVDELSSDLTALTPALNGVYFKLGTTSGQTGSSYGTVTFTTPFPSASYNVFLEPYNANGALLWESSIISKTASGFTFRTAYSTGGTDWTNYFNDIQWMAVYV